MQKTIFDPEYLNQLTKDQRSKLADVIEAASDEDRKMLLDILSPKKQGNDSKMKTTMFSDILAGTQIHGNYKIPLTKSQQFTKLSDYLQSCSVPDLEKILGDVIERADFLPAKTLKSMSQVLASKAKAKEFAGSRKAQRLVRLQASIENQSDDEQINAAVQLATGELRRLGYNINASGPDGFNVAELDKKMTELNWSTDRRLALKAAAAAVGVIE